jgi:membrane protein DedA with SNARE-associated domain
VNLIAGGARYSAWRFFAPVVLGETVWVLLFGGLGFVFADQWADLSSQVSDLMPYVVGLMALMGVAAVWLRRRAQLSHGVAA